MSGTGEASADPVLKTHGVARFETSLTWRSEENSRRALAKGRARRVQRGRYAR